MKLSRSIVFLAIACIFFAAGCAEIKVPTVNEILKEPLGEGSVKRGMTKGKVESIYGKPTVVSQVTSDGWAGTREEWFYKAEYGRSLPVGAGYFSKDLYLYFDGENLTNIARTPKGIRQGEVFADEALK